MTSRGIFRIGAGAGFSSDRLDPAIDLAERGGLDALVFECIGERTLAFAHRDRRLGPSGGYNPLLTRRMRAVLPSCVRNKTRIITNMGVANPLAAAAAVVETAAECGLHGVTVAALEGDNVSEMVGTTTELWEGGRIGDMGRDFIGANAYLGADAVLAALETDADVIITGRVADPSLFLAPMRRRFGWATDDWPILGAGTVIGHLLECAGQVSGGYFADPNFKDVPDLARLGFPLAEVDADGGAVITKLPGSGGRVDTRTVKEQLLYEVHDPAEYLTPDVSADFSGVFVDDEGEDRVRIGGGRGRVRPERLKVTVAFDGGFLAEAEISYAGEGAQSRAELAASVLRERVREIHRIDSPLRIDLIGVNSLHAAVRRYSEDAKDVRLRCALRAELREEAELALWEVESLLCCGPAGGGGYRGGITPSVVTRSAFIDRGAVSPSVRVFHS